jgi:hypothetical protein
VGGALRPPPGAAGSVAVRVAVADLALTACQGPVRVALTSALVGVVGALVARHARVLTLGQWFSTVSSVVTR